MQKPKYKTPSVIVVGSGRSGTSTVARLLHEDLGVCMGHFLREPSAGNPKGYYEDMLSHGMVRMMRDSHAGCPTERYLRLMNQAHANCRHWGAKDPWFLYLSGEQLKEINPKLCIICQRNLNDTVNSWCKINNNRAQSTINHFSQLTRERALLCHEIKKLLPSMIINFDTRRDEDDLRENIRYMLKVQGIT